MTILTDNELYVLVYEAISSFSDFIESSQFRGLEE